MSIPKNEVDIARNVKTIEWLKTELIGGIAALFRSMIKGGEDVIVDSLAGIIINSYLLGKRIGVSFSALDLKIEQKLQVNIDKDHEIEKWYGDLSALLQHEKDKRG